jgi:hypothetical protein
LENDIEVVSKNPFLQTLQYGFLANTSEAMLQLVKGKKAGDIDNFKDKMVDAIGKKVADMTIPGFIKQPAQWMDTKEKGVHPMGEPIKRKPNSDNVLERLWQNLEMNLPGLRENVPQSSGKGEKKEKKEKRRKGS